MANKNITSGRLARWFDTLADLDFTIAYRPGSQNGNADGLSRQAWTKDDFTLQEKKEMSGQPDSPNNTNHCCLPAS